MRLDFDSTNFSRPSESGFLCLLRSPFFVPFFLFFLFLRFCLLFPFLRFCRLFFIVILGYAMLRSTPGPKRFVVATEGAVWEEGYKIHLVVLDTHRPPR